MARPRPALLLSPAPAAGGHYHAALAEILAELRLIRALIAELARSDSRAR